MDIKKNQTKPVNVKYKGNEKHSLKEDDNMMVIPEDIKEEKSKSISR